MKTIRDAIISFSTLFITAASLALVGCGGNDNNSSTPTDTNIPFQIFPDGYFTEGYTETYQLTGSDNAGGTYEGSLSIETQNQELFDGVSAIPVMFSLEYTNTQDNGVSGINNIVYYTTDQADRRIIGERLVDNGVTLTAISTDILPETATIGDVGAIGDYSVSYGVTSDATWQLNNANNGQAYLFINWNIYTFVPGNIDTSEQQQYLIDQDGTRLAVLLKISNVTYSTTLTFSGNLN
jgi:hypothetical protein